MAKQAQAIGEVGLANLDEEPTAPKITKKSCDALKFRGDMYSRVAPLYTTVKEVILEKATHKPVKVYKGVLKEGHEQHYVVFQTEQHFPTVAQATASGDQLDLELCGFKDGYFMWKAKRRDAPETEKVLRAAMLQSTIAPGTNIFPQRTRFQAPAGTPP